MADQGPATSRAIVERFDQDTVLVQLRAEGPGIVGDAAFVVRRGDPRFDEYDSVATEPSQWYELDGRRLMASDVSRLSRADRLRVKFVRRER